MRSVTFEVVLLFPCSSPPARGERQVRREARLYIL
jgi:hypothetical protein